MSEETKPVQSSGPSSVEQLAVNARAGCSTSFDALVERLGPRLLRYLSQKVRDTHAAEDLLQETFLKAYRNLGRYDSSRRFTAWIFTIAARLAASHRRSLRTTVSLDDVDPPDSGVTGPAEAVEQREQNENLWNSASRVLSSDQFHVLWLRYAEAMSTREIAEAMDKSVDNVKVLLHRARGRLAQVRGGSSGLVSPDRDAVGCDCAMGST